MSSNRGVRVDRRTFPRVDLEVKVGDAELGVTGLPEEANCVTGLHRAALRMDQAKSVRSTTIDPTTMAATAYAMRTNAPAVGDSNEVAVCPLIALAAAPGK